MQVKTPIVSVSKTPVVIGAQFIPRMHPKHAPAGFGPYRQRRRRIRLTGFLLGLFVGIALGASL